MCIYRALWLQKSFRCVPYNLSICGFVRLSEEKCRETALVSYTEQVVNMESLLLNASEFLVTDAEDRVRFSALQDFVRSSGSGTGSIQPREYN
jgi:hypothetical protein